MESDAYRKSCESYCLPNVEMKDYNVNFFFNQQVKKDLITYESIRQIATGQEDDCTTSFLLHHNYFKNYYKMMIETDLKRITEAYTLFVK